MPTRSITADGKIWLVFPSGRITQYDRDEFALMFVHGTGAGARGARDPLLAGRHALARAVARRDERRRPPTTLRLLAAERYVARSRLFGVSESSVEWPGRRAIRRPPHALDRV